MDIAKPIGGGWGDNVYGKRTPPILAGEFDAGDGTKYELVSSVNFILIRLRQWLEGKALSEQQGTRTTFGLRRPSPGRRHELSGRPR